LARALAVDPEILLCDEPFSALDPLIRREMQDELIRLQKMMHKTIIFITHDFLEALKLGDRIAIMKDGEVVQMGTPEEIVSQPVDDYVRAFTRDIPRVKVLTAQTIMQPITADAPNHLAQVPATTTLQALIPLTAASDTPLAVTDGNGSVVGVVDRTAVMLALAETTAN
jgi:glycine betaine/proline transport system ATP-binding protein